MPNQTNICKPITSGTTIATVYEYVYAAMDCFGRIRSGYSSENCQALHVNTNIVYSIEEDRFPGLREDDCEASLTICPEYLAAQRLTHGTQPLTAHLGVEDQPIDEAHRELYSLLDDLDFLSDDLATVSDEFVDTLLDITSAIEDDFTTRPTLCPSHNETTTGSPDCDNVFVFGATKTECVPTSFTVLFPDSSCCTSKPRRKSTTDWTLRTSCCGAGIMPKPQKKRRFSSVSEELSYDSYSCLKRQKLSSYNAGNVYDGTDNSDLTVSSSLLSPVGIFLQSYSGRSPLRATSLRQW